MTATRIYTLLILAFVTVMSVNAQDNADVYNRKSLMKDIKVNLKSQNYAKVDDLISKAMAKSDEAKSDAELYNIRTNAMHNLALAEGKKIFLKSGQDTVKYFNYIYKVYSYALLCDSIESVAISKDEKKHDRRYRQNISVKVTSTRSGLRSAGKFFYKKTNFKEAYRHLDMYLSTISSPLVDYTKVKSQDEVSEGDSVSMAKLAVFSAYAVQNHSDAVKWLSLALGDTINRAMLLEIASKSYAALNDTVSTLIYLQQGWAAYPMQDNFYMSLIKYYSDRSQYSLAHGVAVRQLTKEPNSRNLWFIKGKSEQCMEMPDSAIVSFERAINIKADDAEAYSSLGNVYLDMAHKYYNSSTLTINNPQYPAFRKQLNEYYKLACTAFESARKYDEANKSLWLEGLRESYFKLNKGKELKSLEK